MIANIILALGFTSYFTQYPMIAAIHIIWVAFVGALLTLILIALGSKKVRDGVKKEMNKESNEILQIEAIMFLVMFFATGHVILGIVWFVICAICVELEKSRKSKK